MATKLFVGSLSWNVKDDDLSQFFASAGTVVSASVITDRDTGRSKGFGFVQMANDDDNQKAIDELNGKELDGREINVSIAKPKEDRPKRDFGGDRGGNRGGSGGSFRQRSW